MPRRFLTADEKSAIAARVAALERALGIEIVTIVTAKSDAYPQIVWRAFAFGMAFAALAVTLVDLVQPAWVASVLILTTVVSVLGAGALCALATVYVPAFARRFLREEEARAEVTQYAQEEFLGRELFATPGRTALLVVVSLFERRVVVLPDKGLRAHASVAQWDRVVARMTGAFRAGTTGSAVLAGLDAVNELLAGKAIAGASGNVFADAPVVDRRER
ncbi:MAG: hypothetical protein IT522_03860 [Burkholderiales bacterium]|nr:hypothetical protein [Burkholderiales bacterium]